MLTKAKRHTITYEASLTEDGVKIDEIVNGSSNRAFGINCSEDQIQEFWNDYYESDVIFDLRNEPHLVHDFAMQNEKKWEEVQP